VRFEAFDVLRRELPVSFQPPPLAWAPKDFPPPRGYWAVTRYEDVRTVSRDPATFASGQGVMLFDNLPPDIQYLNDGWVGLDAPRHTRLRRLVSSAFTPKVMRSLEGWIAHEARQAIADVAGRGECDFFADLVAPFPVAVICDMLGVPQTDRPELMRLTHIGVHFGADAPFERSIDAMRAVIDYAIGLAGERRRQPAGDLLTSLVQAEIDGTRLSDEDVAASFWVILTGGSDTTSTTAAHSMVALGSDPAERRRLQEGSGAIWDTAVEEMLRWATPVLDFRRTATADVEIGGQRIASGDNVLIFYQSANRDESVFSDPSRFDSRRDPNPHFAFGGGGPHFCLGAALARLELRTFFRALFGLLPDIEVSGDPVYLPGPFLDSVESLPCSFSPTEVA
jgi:cytochrome P450